MKILSALALALTAAVASAQTAPGVSIWLKLPKTEAGALSSRSLGAAATLEALLGPAMRQQVLPPNGDDGPSMHFFSPGWSATVPEAERKAKMDALRADWGENIKVEEASALPALGAGADWKMPSSANMFKLAPSLTASGDAARFFDGSTAGSGDPSAAWAGAWAPSRGLSLKPTNEVPTIAPVVPPAPGVPAPATTAPKGRWSAQVQAAADRTGVDPALLAAVAKAKSGNDARMARGDSYGLMGISAAAGRAYGATTEQLLDPSTNLRIGGEILASLLRTFGGNRDRALAAYQVGARAVLRSGGVPNDRSVRDLMNAVSRAMGTEDRDAVLPVRPRNTAARDAATETLADAATAPAGKGVARYRPIIEKVSAQYGVDPKLMEAMVMQEDPSGNPRAVSSRGARGLGQLMPSTARDLGVKNSFDPAQNLRGMARHLKHLTELFGGDRVLVAASYNAGEGTVSDLGRVPRYKETMRYVRRVFANYAALTDERVDVEPYMPPQKASAKKAPR